ncbi:MAG TPA: LLM class flavin-dependent oxidoreductase [Trebonia sp.]|jgi:alkanesulfonate monooxygenase SsuD/methylene tetrahydromethanopterin reductase-like flavin-dependent oxidoreductase (luciferase family)
MHCLPIRWNLRLFGVPRERAWITLEENYRLLRRLWTEEKVRWEPPADKPTIRRGPLSEVTTHPRTPQQPPRIWHGSATHEGSVELAAEFGDPIFSANVSNAVDRYAGLARHYRRRWKDRGRDPRDAVVGAGTAGFFAAKTSQEAIEAFRPTYEGLAHTLRTSEGFLELSSALVGSPQQIIDKVHRY